MDKCSICGKENNSGGGYKNSYDGFDHSHCWNCEHPPKMAKSIKTVISGGPDPVAAREILMNYFANEVPVVFCDKLVDVYNEHLIKSWRLRCEG